jgi:glucose-1-phosphate cytidylyltransferase
MKAVILAGGFGTRLSEETAVKPKPMVEIGGKPILWHIMKCYSHHGINEFVICAGYKSLVIKKFFADYFIDRADVTFDLMYNTTTIHTKQVEPWKVTVVDTGADSMTGGRLLRVKEFLGNRTFCMTYGDGVADIDISKLVAYHHSHGKYATVTAVQPPGRFGLLSFREDGKENTVKEFSEKTDGEKNMINGGFFVLEPAVFDYIRHGDSTIWEKSPLELLASEGQLSAYPHRSFWHPMDTLRDKSMLNDLWDSGKAPWKVWDAE